jgi:hypothetical protein
LSLKVFFFPCAIKIGLAKIITLKQQQQHQQQLFNINIAIVLCFSISSEWSEKFQARKNDWKLKIQ